MGRRTKNPQNLPPSHLVVGQAEREGCERTGCLTAAQLFFHFPALCTPPPYIYVPSLRHPSGVSSLGTPANKRNLATAIIPLSLLKKVNLWTKTAESLRHKSTRSIADAAAFVCSRRFYCSCVGTDFRLRATDKCRACPRTRRPSDTVLIDVSTATKWPMATTQATLSTRKIYVLTQHGLRISSPRQKHHQMNTPRPHHHWLLAERGERHTNRTAIARADHRKLRIAEHRGILSSSIRQKHQRAVPHASV